MASVYISSKNGGQYTVTFTDFEDIIAGKNVSALCLYISETGFPEIVSGGVVGYQTRRTLIDYENGGSHGSGNISIVFNDVYKIGYLAFYFNSPYGDVYGDNTCLIKVCPQTTVYFQLDHEGVESIKLTDSNNDNGISYSATFTYNENTADWKYSQTVYFAGAEFTINTLAGARRYYWEYETSKRSGIVEDATIKIFDYTDGEDIYLRPVGWMPRVHYNFDNGIEKLYFYDDDEFWIFTGEGNNDIYSEFAQLEAIPKAGYEFSHWEGYSGDNNLDGININPLPVYTFSERGEDIYVHAVSKRATNPYVAITEVTPSLTYNDYAGTTMKFTVEYEKGNLGTSDNVLFYYKTPGKNGSNCIDVTNQSSVTIDVSSFGYGKYEFFIEVERSFNVITKSETVYSSMLFEWEKPKVKGEKYEVTANEFNEFRKAINQARLLNGLSEFSYAAVEPGDEFTAKLWMGACDALYEDGSGDITTIPIPARAIQDGPVRAQMFDTVKNKLNPLLQ